LQRKNTSKNGFKQYVPVVAWRNEVALHGDKAFCIQFFGIGYSLIFKKVMDVA